MGLDMYVTAKKGFAAKDAPCAGLAGLPEFDYGWTDPEPIKFYELAATVGYWRKANQVHDFFVRTIQGGKDDCREYEIDIDALDKLKGIVSEILADTSKAAELLPPAKGFFFGSDKIDEFYWQDIERTKALIDKLMPLYDQGWRLYYSASW